MTYFRRLGALCVTFLACAAPAHAALSLTPAPGSPYATTDQANPHLAVGDLNGDGIPDVVTVVPGASVMTVLFGTAAGGLTASPTRYPVGTNPFDVALADLDGDGDLDAAIANQQDKTVTVLLGNNAGAFTQMAGSPFAAGDFLYSLAIGDFDGDGKPDIVTTQNRGVVVLRNTGAGFVAGTPVATSQTYGYDALVADVNKDGKADVVEGDTGLEVLLGDGTGKLTLTPGSPITSAGASIIDIAAGDLNGDGKLDLVGGSRGTNVVRAFLGDGTGGFTPAGPAVPAGTSPHGIAIGDLDLDGHADVATSNFVLTGNLGASVLLGDGAGGLALAPGSPFPADTYGDDVKLADMNKDGKPDLVVSTENHSVAVLLNTSSAPGGAGTPTPTATATASPTATGTVSATPTVTVTSTPTPAPLGDEAAAALACGSSSIVLTHTGIQGGKVRLRGAAKASLIGQPVQITFVASKQMVAQTTVGADGTFTATAKVPPKKLRNRSNARYVAVSGTASSPAQKLTRRVTFTSVKSAAGKVTARGAVTGKFKRGAKVKLTQRVSCTQRKTVATTTLGRHGTFSASFAAPTGAIASVAVYKARTSVLSGRRSITTFTLAEPAQNP